MSEPILHQVRGFRLATLVDQQRSQGIVAGDVIGRLPQTLAVGLFRSGPIVLMLVTLPNVINQVRIAGPKLQSRLKVLLSGGEIPLLIEAESIFNGNPSAILP